MEDQWHIILHVHQNMPTALPSLQAIPYHISEAELQFDGLVFHFICVSIETHIISRAEYNCESSRMVGFTYSFFGNDI